MSEYDFVEQPFLIQLASLGWEVLDQGQGFPSDPAKSLRANFRDVVLPDVFREAVREINRTGDGEPWLTDRQLDELLEQILDAPGNSLVEIKDWGQVFPLDFLPLDLGYEATPAP